MAKKLLLLLYLLAVTGVVYSLYARWQYDDPFITYRYARNLASGQGLVYNPGERVLSTTTPGFALLLSGLSLLWPDLPHLANLAGALSLALGGLFLWDLGRAWEAPAAGWAGLLLYPIFPLLATTLGSETPLYLALCLGAFAGYARRSWNRAAAFSALAVLARPDGVLVPVILSLHYLVQAALCTRRAARAGMRGGFFRTVLKAVPWRAVLVFLALALPWFVFAWAYYGSPLPVTLAAKQQQGGMAISERFFSGFFGLARAYLQRPVYWLETALALLGVVWAAARTRPWLLLLGWTALYFAAYSLLGVSRYFWYYAPLVPGVVAALGLGLQAVCSAARPRGGTLSSLAPLAAGLLLFVVTVGQAAHFQRISLFFDRRPAVYRAVGEWLAAQAPSGARIGALEVGVIGYYARRPMIDFAGLIQPGVARQLTPQATYEDAALWALQAYRPEYLVLHRGLFARLEAYAEEHCRVARSFRGQEYDYSADLDLYACP